MGWQSATDKKSFSGAILAALAEEYGFSLDTPFKDYPDSVKNIIINGTGGKAVKVKYQGQRGFGIYDIKFEGLIKNMEQRYRETASDAMKQQYETFMRITPCKSCKGQRLKPSSLAVTVADKNIYEMTTMPIEDLSAFIKDINFSERELSIGEEIIKEINARLDFLINVGLDYLSLSRSAGTLSGAPKIRACEIIEELEERKRGIYGGAVGYIDFAGNLDTCIGIRLVYKKDGMICVRSGAGIVYDSVPENEYMEGVNKAKAVVEAIEKGSN